MPYKCDMVRSRSSTRTSSVSFENNRCIMSTFPANLNSPWLVSNIAMNLLSRLRSHRPPDTPFFWTKGRNAASNAGKSEPLSRVPNRLHSPSDYNEMQPELAPKPLPLLSVAADSSLPASWISTSYHYNDWHVLLILDRELPTKKCCNDTMRPQAWTCKLK